MADGYRFDGLGAKDIAAALDLPAVELLESTTSTLDVAHRLGAAGFEAGTLVIAEHQTAGRGRSGSHWTSRQAHGLWLTLLERPRDTSGLEVLSLRAGLRSARALDRFAAEPVRLKWPNDLYVDGRKLGGILIEARWREGRLDWVAVGIGVNVKAPDDVPLAAALDPGTVRVEVLSDLIPALRDAAQSAGNLTPVELIEWNARDMARGRECVEPARGTVEGINAGGELLVALADSIARFRSGSLVLANPS
ncbi:MAG TPA: biotin--[acetyl-CoA-carboxylase] ligase [Gemmatimonadaceae bacterium]|nr:biotin--[acetyl-CoA-carboxylase] ligase [Gemmatimonadaceae bacterium]